jgi:hypothetical protein
MKAWMLACVVVLAVFGVTAQELKLDPQKVEVSKFTPQPQREAPITDRAECSCQSQCEAMWSAVPEGLESATHMRVRIASDSFVETYAPYRGQVGVMSGRAMKSPNGHGGYRIRGDFSSRYGGPDDENSAERLFYLIVNEAAVGVNCPATQPSK